MSATATVPATTCSEPEQLLRFFRSQEEQKNEEDEIPLSLMRVDYAVDTSGSTSGQIIEFEKQSAEQLMELVPGRQIIDWNSQAHRVDRIKDLYSHGCTEPETIIPFLRGPPEATGLVLYSDGCIPAHSMERFKSKMRELSKMPVIVILTLAPSYDLDYSIQLIERQVNMSIPEGCLAMSDDVCVVLNVSGAHKLLMTKGSFNVFGAIPELDHGLKLAALPDFDMLLLKDVRIRAPLPAGYLWLNGFDDQPLKLAAVYSCAHNDGPLIPDQILAALCNRVYLPNLDLNQMHLTLTQMMRRLNDNPALDAARDELAHMAVSDQAGSQAHRDLIEKCRQLKNNIGGSNGCSGGPPRDLRKTRGLISKFLAMIADYRSNNTSFVLGSNRANRAKVFQEDQLTELGNCIGVECPIYLQQEPACLLLKRIPKTDECPDQTAFITRCTSDWAMESPFHFGQWLSETITPGIYGLTYAETARENPYSREPVIGFLPLSTDPMVVMRHMSKMFGQSRELWHLCRAYISMASHYLANRQWAQPLVRDQLNRLIDNYQATIDLRGGTEKVPFRQALKNVMTDYPTCLRDRFPDDVQAIITTVETLLPDFQFPKQKILGMMEVIRHFARFLQEHKKNNGFDFKPYVMNVDEYDHYLSSKTDTQAVIARILWRDADCNKGEYRGLKLQAAVDRALNDKRFGPELLKAFTGRPTDPTKFQIALPEPTGDHFGPERFGEWTNEGMPKRMCIYCGEKFQDNGLQTANTKRLQHLKKHCGQHFYNGHLAVLETVKQKGRDADTVKIFKEVKLRLLKKYGERSGFLHTQRCRVRMLEMIEKLKATTGPIVLPDAGHYCR